MFDERFQNCMVEFFQIHWNVFYHFEWKLEFVEKFVGNSKRVVCVIFFTILDLLGYSPCSLIAFYETEKILIKRLRRKFTSPIWMPIVNYERERKEFGRMNKNIELVFFTISSHIIRVVSFVSYHGTLFMAINWLKTEELGIDCCAATWLELLID